jgi:hypothetical protein
VPIRSARSNVSLALLAIVLVATVGSPFSAFAQGETDCRNGLFPRYGPDFERGRIEGKAGDKVRFQDDAPGCPSTTDAKCVKKAYLVPGDTVLVGKRMAEWICAWYQPKKGAETVGWIPSASVKLEVLPAPSLASWDGVWIYGGNVLTLGADASTGNVIVSGKATWDGGRGNVHEGAVKASAPPEGHRLMLHEGECEVTLERVGELMLAKDNAQCGGLNVSFSGVYRKAPRPPDVAAFLARVETCEHFAGEEPYDQARADEIALALKREKCEQLRDDARALRQKYPGDALTTTALRVAMEPFGGIPETAHCATNEERVFSCSVEGSHKVLSICARPSLSAGSPELFYRFGRSGQVELEYPKKGRRPAEAFWFTRAATGGTLRFMNGKTAYELVVDDSSARLFVYLEGGSKPKPIDCRLPFEGQLPSALGKWIPRRVP